MTSRRVAGGGRGAPSHGRTSSSDEVPTESALQVCVRIRPPVADALIDRHMPAKPLKASEVFRTNKALVWKWSSTDILYQDAGDYDVPGGGEAKQYRFPYVFNQATETIAVYDAIAKPLVRRVCEGTNCCVFAFGQTNSGKTYTISGTPQSPGIISLAVRDLFHFINTGAGGRKSLLRVAFLEVYNEKLKDLLASDDDHTHPPLLIIDDPDRGGPRVKNLTERVVSNVDEVLQLAIKGEQQRAFGCNNVHEHASRSHVVFQLILETRQAEQSQVCLSTLNVVDLAGSELCFQLQEGDSTMDRKAMREGANIRKSLLALSRVVETLASHSAGHIPYRDSLLTRILQSALGGNSATAMIATINPWTSSVDDRQTNATLRFSMTAQSIKNQPKRVNMIDPEQAMIQKYEDEMKELQKQMEDEREALERRQEQLMLQSQQREGELAELQHEKEHLRETFKQELGKKASEAESLRRKMQNLEKFILSANSITRSTRSDVQGIGIDEERDRLARKGILPRDAPRNSDWSPGKAQGLGAPRPPRSKSMDALLIRSKGEALPPKPPKEIKAFHDDLVRDMLHSQRARIEQLEKENASLRHALELRNAENAVQEGVIQTRDAEKAVLEGELQDARAQIAKLEGHVSDLQGEQGELGDRYMECTHELEALQKKYVALQEEHRSLGVHQAQILNQQGIAQGNLRNAWDQVVALEQLVPHIAAQQGRGEDLPGLSAEIAEKMREINAFIADAKGEIGRLEETVRERAEQLMKQQNELMALQQELNALRNERDTLFKERQAVEQYHQWKKEHKTFYNFRHMFGKKDESYRPWHKFLEADANSPSPASPSPKIKVRDRNSSRDSSNGHGSARDSGREVPKSPAASDGKSTTTASPR